VLRETASPDLPLNLGDALLNLGDALPFGTTHPTAGISSSSVKSRAIAPQPIARFLIVLVSANLEPKPITTYA
jgi:hypothetical protein